MADNITPPSGTPPASTPEGGNGTPPPGTPPASSSSPQQTPPGDPKIPTDPVAAAEYWKNRHSEATSQNTRVEQRNARYRDLYGDLSEPTPPAPPAGNPNNSPNVEAIVKQTLKNWEVDQQLQRVPSIAPYNQEVKDLVATGKITLERAIKIVAEDHNIALSPTMPADIEQMPTAPGGGGMPPSGGSSLSTEHEQSLARDGIAVESAKKHMPLIGKAWNKALKR